MQHYQDIHRLVGRDAVIYKRNDVSRPVWYGRFKVPGERRYVVRSSKTTDLGRARVWAEKEFDRLCFKLEHDLPIFTRSLNDAYKVALAELEDDVEQGRAHKQTLANFKSVMTRYALAFMGSQPVDKIGVKTLSDYWQWRRRYWTDGPGRSERSKRKHVEAPTETTLYQEGRAISRCFKAAISKGWLTKERCPDVFPRTKKKAKRRPAFDAGEWGKLHQTLYIHALEAKRPEVKQRRLRLYYYAQAVVASGMRPPEARTLRWRDVVPFQTQEGKDTYALWVRGKGKQRRIVAQPEIRSLLDRWKAVTPWSADDHFVFADDEGKEWAQAGWNFRKALRRIGLETNRHGDAFTVYSLRHTYATFRLVYGDIDIYLLARNMDTGVAMIEQHYGQDEPASRADLVIRDRRMDGVNEEVRRHAEDRQAGWEALGLSEDELKSRAASRLRTPPNPKGPGR